MQGTPEPEKITLVIPVFNDWEAAGVLLDELDRALAGNKGTFEVMLVDDASTRPADPSSFKNKPYTTLRSIEVLELRRNLGHQRAIVTALAYIERHKPSDAVIVMDGDGEDLPADVPRLLEKYLQDGGTRLVFARRQQRSEGFLFRLFYSLYRAFFYVLTGQRIRFGNFSMMPRRVLERLVAVSELWNHYSSGVLKSRVPYAEIPTNRGRRFAGNSQMDFVALVVHGLSSLSVYGDLIGVRALIAMCALIVLCVIGVGAVITIRTVTSLAIPGWASYLTGLFAIILMQVATMLLFFVFMILHNRTAMSFLPNRDSHHFVLRLAKLR